MLCHIVVDESDKPVILSYRSQPREKLVPPMAPALGKALPGAMCWAVLFFLYFDHSGGALPFFIPALWVIAILCAVISVGDYWNTLKPWYVWVNWTINMSGLALSVVGICYFFWAMILR
jgi:hypothetical protein